jgi:hypothetical protein
MCNEVSEMRFKQEYITWDFKLGDQEISVSNAEKSIRVTLRKRLEASTVPTDNGFRSHHDQTFFPPRPTHLQ